MSICYGLCVRLLGRDRLGEVSREVNIDAVHDGEVYRSVHIAHPRITQSRTVRQELERNNVDETLKTIDSSGDTDDLVGRVGNRVVIVIADDDRSTFSSGDLGKSRSDLGVERVSGHDEDDAENEHGQANLAYYLRKVLVHKRKGPVLELSSEDSLAVHVGNLLDLQGTLKTSSI